MDIQPPEMGIYTAKNQRSGFLGGNILVIKGARTIAEYVIRKWIQDNNFDMEWFHLEMNGDEGILIDRSGDTLQLQYDKHSKKVIVL